MLAHDDGAFEDVVLPEHHAVLCEDGAVHGQQARVKAPRSPRAVGRDGADAAPRVAILLAYRNVISRRPFNGGAG